MRIIFKHVLTWVIYALLLSLIILGVTFYAFPVQDWRLIFERNLFDVPFLSIVFVIPLVIGLIIGLTTGWYWRQRLHLIARQLDALLKGEIHTGKTETYPELKKIHQTIGKLQAKHHKQTELTQRLATERANEREEILQDVVIQERNRLARELHDSVSQQLFAASMMMSAINETSKQDNPDVTHQLKMVENMIHQSQLEMRALLLHLRPVALKGKSLQEGIEELFQELTQKVPLEITYNVESFQVEKGIEDHLFRILQESISNTLRHAKATSLRIMLIERDEHIILRIEDNGVGFDVENVRTSSYGLQNMEERASEIGGMFKVISLPNEGTKIEVKVPRIHQEGDSDD